MEDIKVPILSKADPRWRITILAIVSVDVNGDATESFRGQSVV
jgi:hypothetical protein